MVIGEQGEKEKTGEGEEEEDVQIIQEEQQKEKTGEGEEGEDVEIIEDPEREEEAQELELMAPPGDWWGTLYTFDQVKQMIDEIPKKYKVGMKQIGRKGKGQSSKKKGGKVIIFKIVKLINKLIKLKLLNHQCI